MVYQMYELFDVNPGPGLSVDMNITTFHSDGEHWVALELNTEEPGVTERHTAFFNWPFKDFLNTMKPLYMGAMVIGSDVLFNLRRATENPTNSNSKYGRVTTCTVGFTAPNLISFMVKETYSYGMLDSLLRCSEKSFRAMLDMLEAENN